MKLVLAAFLTFLMLVHALVLHAFVNNSDHSNEVSAIVFEIKILENETLSTGQQRQLELNEKSKVKKNECSTK